MTQDTLPPIRTVAILGCGLIGASWAALCLAHGHDVTAWDPDAGARADFAAKVAGPLAQLREITPDLPEGGALTLCDTLAEAVANADLVQENAPENVPLKQALYAEVVAAAPAQAVISSSTSSLTWSALSEGMAEPTRLITAHPFNPPHLMPLVELYAATPEITARTRVFYEGLGRAVVILRKDAVGHIANRLASALWREAVNIVAEGIADVEEVDRALVNGPGLRWSVTGAHMAYHMGGGSGGIRHYLAHLGPSQQARWATLGAPELTPEVCAMLVAGVEAEAAGRTIPELEAERDAALIAALKLRQQG
ncbi:3-hydroxyacyl-CoA dehydrogenase NAD-binding domain-containing protein [Pseudooceanicola nanhaiensis]|uniref:3-hydroxyacyl-CoA dehydrogenase NAD-binding domain-containing protein n=1 Tax=Pseudooceanicola nanhaiensis TaxID=375761 RepID=UPI001CD7D566|nr:3-hydroxyacyl-CoA dehydrogenase NAD-binding domain-containing protein [Pseudooceanicola nanhaiensis]MCA0920812.1 3-hydroxyacyl-CoA dehydrogenase [Pseudooceanicola nanhaiensis]